MPIKRFPRLPYWLFISKNINARVITRITMMPLLISILFRSLFAIFSVPTNVDVLIF